ncbi:hypothetical protein MRB53_013947 [Persea americana]|uniref:Uncharacterized protein n=1 Tax=Persea americana TaxID=3435 RepID=A0ACC2K9K0_PERAE|nr:hypothetical protein MRB53_013947 [Persea americana]
MMISVWVFAKNGQVALGGMCEQESGIALNAPNGVDPSEVQWREISYQFKVLQVLILRGMQRLFEFFLKMRIRLDSWMYEVEFDENGKACGVTSEGETAKCKKVVCDPSYLLDKTLTGPEGWTSSLCYMYNESSYPKHQ